MLCFVLIRILHYICTVLMICIVLLCPFLYVKKNFKNVLYISFSVRVGSIVHNHSYNNIHVYPFVLICIIFFVFLQICRLSFLATAINQRYIVHHDNSRRSVFHSRFIMYIFFGSTLHAALQDD